MYQKRTLTKIAFFNRLHLIKLKKKRFFAVLLKIEEKKTEKRWPFKSYNSRKTVTVVVCVNHLHRNRIKSKIR